MINILITGCSGAMGHVLVKECSNFNNLKISAGVDVVPTDEFDFPVYSSFSAVKESIDVVIDFSSPKALKDMLSYGKETKTPLVVCTTGYSKEDENHIQEACKDIPIFFSANMSLGINLMKNLLSKAANLLYGDFDIEIIEKHHNRKVDSPSGTAYLLGNAIKNSIDDSLEYVHGREGYHKRDVKEIGMHSIRGGNIVGEHEVIFAGAGEVLSFKHEALSKNVFAVGAFRAASFIADKAPGHYDMDDMLNLE